MVADAFIVVYNTVRVRHMWFRTVGVRDIGKEGLRLVVVGGSVRGR